MFVSQVTFAAEIAHEEFVKNIIEKKEAKGIQWEGFIASEAWRSETSGEVAYTWVLKWESKAHFMDWMKRPEHIEGHKQMRKLAPDPNRPRITKTTKQYEVVSF